MNNLASTHAPRSPHDTVVLPWSRRGERRTRQRVAPHGEYVATIGVNGRQYTGTLKDVTTEGAGFLVSEAINDLHVQEDALLHLSIQTPWEKVYRKGRIVWTRMDGQAWRFGVRYVDLPADADCIGLLNMDKVKVDPALALQVPASFALRRQVLPFALADGKVHVACMNVVDHATLQAVEKLVARPVSAEPAEPDSLRRALDRVYGDLAAVSGVSRPRSADARQAAEGQSDDMVALCDELLHAGILRQASDIHIDPENDGVEIRFRVDGVLEHYRKLPAAVHNSLISRFKVLCGMDIAEKRAPQDGAFKHRYGRTGQMIDIRVATLPTKHGERMTLRLLALQTQSLTLERLGMSESDLCCFEQAIAKPHGMILLTGSTGCGKTTTLYAAIRRLMDRENLNILTVEDPIEYEIKGVAQVEVDSADKVTFVKALRSVLRHDPDVVMIGEIRDAETAEVAIKASLTGHLVFSTLHTNSAVSVITRLSDMGVDRFLIAATLRLAVAQRLVRQLCSRCRTARPLTTADAAALGRPELAGHSVFEPKGCIYCGSRGYVGRIGLFEMIPFDEDWSRGIARGEEEADLITRMRSLKLKTLLDDGVEKIFNGITSVREVLTAVSVW